MCNLPQLRTKTTFLSGWNVLDPKSPCIKLIVNNAITLKSSNLEFFKTFEISTDNAVPHQSRDICVRVKIVTYFWFFIINFLNARLCASKVHRWCHVDWEIHSTTCVVSLHVWHMCLPVFDANKDVYTTGVFTYLILIQITKTYSPSIQTQNICFIDTKDVKLLTYRMFISYTCDIFLIWLLVNIFW